jgi:SP family arabinose:H+ symporter-like MFS transporter
MITVGILVSYIVAVIVLLALPHSAGNLDWRLILGIGAIPAVLAVALRSRMPESPRWLMLHDRYADTRKAFGQLGMETTEEEIRAAAEQLKSREQERQRKTQWTKGVKRALIVVCVFFIFQQITGINIPFYYGPKILATFFQTGHNAVAAGGVAFLTDIPKSVVVMVGFSFFITSFAIGVGGTGWLIQGEVFPTSVRGRAAAIGAAVDWVANFALIEVFPSWQSAWGLAWVMISFAVLSVVAIGFVYKFLPETKGRSVEDIVHIFEKQAEASKAPV